MLRKNHILSERTAAALLAVLMFMFSVPARTYASGTEAAPAQGAAKSGFTLTDARYPAGALSLGLAFTIKGVITSNYKITKVWGGIYNADGTRTAQYREAKPNALKYDIKGFDNYIKFASLQVGEYIFRIQATDAKGYTAAVIDSPFTVRDNGKIPSAITLYEGSLPADTLPKSSAFTMCGLISSSYPIAKVWGGIYKADGMRTAQYMEAAPNASAYTLNKKLALNKLAEGSYIYKVEARDTRGYTEVLAEKSFTISADSAVQSDIAVYGASFPTGIIKLKAGFAIKGVVYSTYPLRSVKAGVYYKSGAPTGVLAEKDPNATTFDLYSFDSSMKFGTLMEGEYIYRVEAVDSTGYSAVLVDSAFEIKSAELSDGSAPAVLKGIDVSSFQNNIDWTKVAASGLDFAIIRAATTNNTDADYMEDRFFTANYAMAKAAGLKVGTYIYTSAANKSEMKYNIECLLRTLDGRSFDMPVYIDVEAKARQSGVGKTALTEIIRYGCSLIREAGYEPGVYASLDWFKNYLDYDVLSADNNEIWLAAWTDDPSKLDYSDFCVTWQYTSDGTVDGIEGRIDMDYRYIPDAFELYAVNISGALHGTVSASAYSAKPGDKITLIVTPDKGYAVKSVKYGGLEAVFEGGNTYSFIMPAEDTLAAAYFERLIGDVTGEGEVNSKDLIRMMKYLSGEDVYVVAEALDTDGSGGTDARDLVRLMDIISG